jgi:Tfp pilus assembly PilM family ATPase
MAHRRGAARREELMARLLAIDWDRTEARYVVADARGQSLSFEAAGSLPMSGEKDTAASRAQLGEALRAALAGKAGRATTLLSIDRGQVEMVSLMLPPASDSELPEMVRNQAMRENTAIAEDSVLDFLPSSSNAMESRKVTAVALSRPRLEQLQEVLTGAGLAAKAISLRPYAAAALVLGVLADRNETCLVVHLLAEEVDLIVLSGGQAVFWRTLRQPNASHDRAAAQRLLSEIQRTLLVAQPQFPGQTVKALYLCGGLDEHPSLVAALGDGLSMPLTLVDPFAAHGGLPVVVDTPGRFAPLVGMLASEARGESHAIDFLHPRRRPAPPDRRRILALAGAAVAVIALLGGYRVWSDFSVADEKVEELSAEFDRLNDQLKQAEQRQKVIAAIENWSKSDVNWLDELRDLSLRFPGGRDAVVLRMGLNHSRDSGGTIDLVGIVRDPVVVSRIESNLRDEHHQISSRHMQERLQEDNYSWHFEASIGVTPRDPKEYVSHLPPEQRPVAPTRAPRQTSSAQRSGREAAP